MDTNLSQQVAQVVRDTLKDELREQTRKQRRTARLYTGAGAAALYAGAAAAAFLVLVLDLALPAWAAALVAGILLFGLAVVLKQQAARPGSGDTRAAELGAPAVPPVTPPGGIPFGTPPVPPAPPAAPAVPRRESEAPDRRG
ncbi:phage holin family protein [Streptomyces sp. NPDC002994]|uniref:phage holin family protein n=1 Tax=Streptomyces sp. NPDC002994 TaxID=3154441 RepID=UPI0033A9AB9F